MISRVFNLNKIELHLMEPPISFGGIPRALQNTPEESVLLSKTYINKFQSQETL